jgi:oxygen-independent coproporphyrinogen-3 oxidase
MEYADAISIDIAARATEWPYRVVDSVFIGGGTPSLLPPAAISKILTAVFTELNVDEDVEVTIETNPATLTEEKLNAYMSGGINRISIGIQSFDNVLLRLLGRVHDKNDAFNAIRMTKKAGFDNINVDLMFAIPGQTLKQWKDTVRQCIFLEPQHISLYSLQIEEGTIFNKLVEEGTLTPTSEELDREMYREALHMLKNAGFNHYEISNAALPGYESRHNLKYWSYEEYLGIGPGASSFIGGRRYSNFTRMTDYLKAIKRGVSPEDRENSENYTIREEMGVFVFTGLRKTGGFDINDFEKKFEVDFFDIYDPALIERYKGYLEIRGMNLLLTEEGRDISNSIMAEFV